MTGGSNKDLARLFSVTTDFATLNTTFAEVMSVTAVNQMVMVSLNVSGEDAEEDISVVTTTPWEHLTDEINFIMSAILTPIVCTVGMVGNMLSIVTWNRPGMGSSTGRYLTGQAVANFFMLLLFLVFDSIQCWCPMIKYSLVYGIIFSYFVHPIYYYTILCNIWFTVGVTVDRFIMVCWIEMAKKLCSKSRANFGLSLISVIGFLINIPHFAWFIPVYDGNVISDNSSSRHHDAPALAFVASEFMSSQAGMIYNFWIHYVFITFLPWVSILLLNVRIIYKIHKANRRMANKKTTQAVKKSKASENQITRLLLAVTFSFLLFDGFNCIPHCLWAWEPVNANSRMVSLSLAVGKNGFIFNSALNFVLYCLAGRRFREELLKMFGLVKKDMLQPCTVHTPSRIVASTTAT